jgi:integrase
MKIYNSKGGPVFGGLTPPYMTKDEVRDVLEGVENKPLIHLLINFLWQTRARVTKAFSVKVSDIDFYSKAYIGQ